MCELPLGSSKNISLHGKYQKYQFQTVLRFALLTHFVKARLLLWQKGEPPLPEPVQEVSPTAWQGTVPEVTGLSLLQHFNDCIACLLCISDGLLKTERSAGDGELCVNFYTHSV